MSILGIGIDIVEIERIEKVLSRNGNRFAKRILSYDEWIKYQHYNQPVNFLSKRFVVKEAASKALGTGMKNGLSFFQFEVFNDELGKPKLKLHKKAAELADKLGVIRIHVTLADEHHYACSTVIFEGE